MSECSKLRIYFGTELANLYDVGYLTTDLYQLFTFSEMLERPDRELTERWFGSNARPFNRYAGVLDKFRRSSEIREAKKGSLELIVAVGSLLTSIIVPLAVIYVQRNLGTRQVAFEVSVDDPNIESALRTYANGTFGTGQQGLEMFFSALKQLNYSIRLQAQDAYLIDDVLNRYAQRMVKTIDKP